MLTENRKGLVVDARLSQATGKTERDMVLELIQAIPGQHRITLGADKNLRHAGFRCEDEGAQRDASRGSDRQQTALGH